MRPDLEIDQIHHLLQDETEFDTLMAAFHELYEMYFLDQVHDYDAFDDITHPQNVTGLAITHHNINGSEVNRPALSLRVREYTNEITGRPSFPSEISGIPVHIRVIGNVRAGAGYRTRQRPVPGGFSIHNSGAVAAGTLSCTIKYNGNRALLSNNHVFVDPAGVNMNICQPGRLDGGAVPADNIATVGPTVAINFGAGANNQVDAAIGNLGNAANAAPGVTRGGKTPKKIGTPNLAPRLKQSVQKSGRTTGTTRGSISGAAVVQNVDYGTPAAPRIAHFINQIEITGTGGAFGAGGDSGSLVTDQVKNQPVGLYFADNAAAGVSFANPITTVLTELTTAAGHAVTIEI